MNPKILIGCPTWEGKKYCLKEYAEAIKKLDYDNFDVLIVDNSKDDSYLNEIKKAGFNAVKGPWHEKARDRIIESRNLIKEYALKNGYDYFFSLEQDVIVQPDTLKKLLSHNKQIISGIVMNNLPVGDTIKLMPMIYVPHKLDSTGLDYISEDALKKSQLIEIKACALSCVLIHKDVLSKITFRYTGGFDDMMFCKDALDAGFKIYADTSVKPKHLHSSWEGIEK
ncbi:MAG: hypothetical protein QW666_00950 [Candidatus Woesearchaeota archaeon]